MISNSFSTFQTRAIFYYNTGYQFPMPYNVDVFVSCLLYLFNLELQILEFYVLKIGLYIYRLKISTQATRCDNALLSQSKTCSDQNNESSLDFHCEVLNRLYTKIFYIFDGVSSIEYGQGGHVIAVIYARETTTADARSYFKHIQTLK